MVKELRAVIIDKTGENLASDGLHTVPVIEPLWSQMLRGPGPEPEFCKTVEVTNGRVTRAERFLHAEGSLSGPLKPVGLRARLWLRFGLGTSPMIQEKRVPV